MVIKLHCLTYKKNLKVFCHVAVFLSSSICICNKVYAAPPVEWDYSLGSKDKFSKPIYSPLKKVESEVLYYPYAGTEQPFTVDSPLGRDYHAYILPQEVFGVESIEIEFSETGRNKEILGTIKAADLIKEIEESIPIIMQSAFKRKQEDNVGQSQQYLLRVKIDKESAVSDQKSKSVIEKIPQEIKQKDTLLEYEVDILVSVIFGQNKVIIKIPPLKDPKEKERLIRELERLAHIMVRQEELLSIEQIPE
ncbi:MAG: hypothetical protein P9M06_01550 [Candidatus Saelkia tenebricola]|nr:hypothetical protein [Candidatus Saelkia tenebricola]